jgi:hypothetical protein
LKNKYLFKDFLKNDFAFKIFVGGDNSAVIIN